MKLAFPANNVSLNLNNRSFAPLQTNASSVRPSASDSVSFSGKSAPKLEDNEENRQALATQFTEIFPFEKYADYQDARAVSDGEEAGSLKAVYTQERIDTLKGELIYYFTDAGEFSVENIQEMISLSTSKKTSEQNRAFGLIRSIEREMGYSV